MKRRELAGQKFNRLTVTSLNEAYKPRAYWNCVCDCGNKLILRGSYITTGHIKSCGCLRKELLSKRKPATKHGMARHKIYHVWSSMKQRCYDPKHISYKYYGGRDIKVCNAWLKFTNFYNDISNTYQEGLQLDRIDNNGNYEPSNVRWVTPKENSNNRRKRGS